MDREVRLFDLGLVSPLRSQTIYHGVAESVSNGAPDTISILSPAEPYVCIGLHQELEKEVDVKYCKTHNLPVYRRKVGGGAVYLDKNQLFYHMMFHKDHAPADVNDIYKKFLKAPVEAYKALGINAVHRPVNDLQVNGKKIGGTGAATIGDCVVVVGSLILDFDYETMVHVLKVPDEKFRDKMYKTMNEYLTTIKRELGRIPPREDIKRLLIRKFEETLDINLTKGEPTKEDMKRIEECDRKLESKEWLNMVSRKSESIRKVKISEGVNVTESMHKAAGGLIRTTTSVDMGAIKDILITGDFFMYPDALGEIEDSTKNLPLDRKKIVEKIQEVYKKRKIQSPGITPEDLAEAILSSKNQKL